MRIIMAICYVFLIVMGVSFAALNAASVSINFYIIQVALPISVWMALSFGVGIMLGCCLFLCRYWRLQAEHRRISNQLKLTEREIKNLRSIPLQDQH